MKVEVRRALATLRRLSLPAQDLFGALDAIEKRLSTDSPADALLAPPDASDTLARLLSSKGTSPAKAQKPKVVAPDLSRLKTSAGGNDGLGPKKINRADASATPTQAREDNKPAARLPKATADRTADETAEKTRPKPPARKADTLKPRPKTLKDIAEIRKAQRRDARSKPAISQASKQSAERVTAAAGDKQKQTASGELPVGSGKEKPHALVRVAQDRANAGLILPLRSLPSTETPQVPAIATFASREAAEPGTSPAPGRQTFALPAEAPAPARADATPRETPIRSGIPELPPRDTRPSEASLPAGRERHPDSDDHARSLADLAWRNGVEPP
ncbi:hypothetical protein R5H30_12270 [Sulfitobacter sp. D35]|uniref:hypothetical protein n=1 Tax=Sulfitobacter sp. D35 TaxID=3083252 RepID=UPI00296EE16B|nr:hypothetical protein [Sulfitobacter sp. D35]MDW4498762.1 hypothetical protein [Sulfitobacter sp. D35]